MGATSQTLAQMVRAKYPGTYDDLDDVTLEKQVLAKYPQYGDLPRTQAAQGQQGQTPGASQITGISAEPASTGWRDSVSRWTDNVMNDIKNGTDVTGVGTVLKKMGAHGVYFGEPEAVGNFMASLPLGSRG